MCVDSCIHGEINGIHIHIYLNVCVCGISCVKLYKQKYLYHLIFLKSLVRKVSFPLCSGKSTRHVIGRSWVRVPTRIRDFPSEKISIVSAVRKSSCFLWRAPFRVLTFTKKYMHLPSVRLADGYKRESEASHHTSDVFTSGELSLDCIPECVITEEEVNERHYYLCRFGMCQWNLFESPLSYTLLVHFSSIDVFVNEGVPCQCYFLFKRCS